MSAKDYQVQGDHYAKQVYPADRLHTWLTSLGYCEGNVVKYVSQVER
jgi:hypothetical protein